MRHQNGGADFVDQRDEGVAIQDLLLGEIGDARQLRCKELIEGRITRLVAARPLRMEGSLRPETLALQRHETLLHAFGLGVTGGAINFGTIGGTATPDLVDDIDGVAAAQKMLGPTFAAIRGAGEVDARLTAAVNHDDGIRMRSVLRNLKFGIELPG